MNVRTYKNEPRYILETNYGCHSNYGWAYTCASEELEAAKMQIDQWLILLLVVKNTPQ